MTTRAYRNALRALLTPAERRVFARLDTPQKLQAFLEKLPPNFELKGETYMSPRRVLKARTVHCAEAAVLAAAILIYHGQPAWLMDIRALPSDQDHIVTLFKQRGLWGAISKTNHAVLRWRDPIYRSPRELAMTYAHEYYLDFGKKSMLAYSRPFSLDALRAEALGDCRRGSRLADGRARRLAARAGGAGARAQAPAQFDARRIEIAGRDRTSGPALAPGRQDEIDCYSPAAKRGSAWRHSHSAGS